MNNVIPSTLIVSAYYCFGKMRMLIESYRAGDPGGGEVLISSRKLASTIRNITIVEMGYEDGEIIST